MGKKQSRCVLHARYGRAFLHRGRHPGRGFFVGFGSDAPMCSRCEPERRLVAFPTTPLSCALPHASNRGVAPRGVVLNARLARGLYFAAQAWRGEPVRAVLAELERSQRWSPDRLQALQWERLRALVRHAWDTLPFYRRLWSAAGLSPEALRSAADWARWPTLEKSELREQGGELRSSRAPRGLKATTSGTSGTPIAVLRS